MAQGAGDDSEIVEKIISTRADLNSYIYATWDEALAELERRQDDLQLKDYVRKTLPNGLPEVMKGKKSMVLFRHIATPNYEISRFMIAADALSNLQPLILEYTKDKFTNRNEWKFSLAKMRFQKGLNSLGEPIFESKTIIDINDSNFKPISTINTHWGQKLVDFHHELFSERYPTMKDIPYDLSDWLHAIGPSAKDYYKSFLKLFLRDAILFENFMTDNKEYSFTKEIILPALLEIEAETGKRPLIVALEPTDIEGDHFWLSHPYDSKKRVDQKLNLHS